MKSAPFCAHIANGGKKPELLVDNAERLSQRLKRNKLHVFEHCGHFSYQDQHKQFAEMVKEWVAGGYKQV